MTTKKGQRWIEICRWEQFQHYTNRDPLWIKNYTRLMADDSYLSLSGHRRAILHGLWLEYAKSGRLVADNTAMIASRLRLRVTRTDLEALNHAGFIRFRASKPLARRYPRSRERSTALTSSTKEADSAASATLPISEPEQSNNHPLTDRLLAEIRDADERTKLVLSRFEDRLFENEFALALESLQHRRSRADLPPLASEARYVVATLSSIEQERRS